MTPAHLGGHMNKVHVDFGAFDYLKKKFDIKTMIDVGCGPGWMVDYARQQGVGATGIDGDPSVKPSILHDYTTGPLDWFSSSNLIWSVEFLEHVEQKYLPNIIETFKYGEYLVCTHALPGETGGHHHVNLKSEDWWIGYLAACGFEYDPEITKEVRAASTMVKGFMQKTGKFFRNVNN